jgi:aminobenzoyl-glutamate utilization protein A
MTSIDDLTALRRDLHRYPEPSWCEFYTTSLIVEELDALGVDELAIGQEALAAAERMAVPDHDVIDRWHARARERGAREDVLDATQGGFPGVVAVLELGEGPSVGLRVDMDALRVEESAAADHAPAAAGFRSENEWVMHACGHDAHMAIGLGVLEAVKAGSFEGTFTVFFQPAEEVAGGGRAMAATDYCESLDYLFALHVGLGHPTGEVVAGVDKPLAMAHLSGRITGTEAHAGIAPKDGDDAIQALATTIGRVHAISRHEDGLTRVNVGEVRGGTASNVVADRASFEGEVRGETTALRRYMKGRFERSLEHAASMHGCSAELTTVSESPRVDSDRALADLVYDVAAETPGVESVRRRAELGASEDATYLMETVGDRGGLASYVIVGTDHPGAHHTATFDVDERTLPIAVEVLSGAVQAIGRDPDRLRDA